MERAHKAERSTSCAMAVGGCLRPRSMPPSENAALPAALLVSNACRRNDAERCSDGRRLRSGDGSHPPPYDPRRGGDVDDADEMWMPGYEGSSSMGVKGDADETDDADECESAGDISVSA